MDNVIKKIIAFADRRQEISAVIQNGSRVNPRVVVDKYADYDIIMGCSNPQIFIDDRRWIAEFGKLLILQLNQVTESGLCWPIFLMQFTCGLRIDLQFFPGDLLNKYHSDSLSKVLLDKHNIFAEQFIPSEESYIVRKPAERHYYETVNDFWWCMINVAKGLARDELSYTKFMYESIVRENFLRIAAWYVSMQHGWNSNTGKFGKFLKKYATEEIWQQIEKTYYTDSKNAFWESVFESCRLVQCMDAVLRNELKITLPEENAEGIIRFMEQIRG